MALTKKEWGWTTTEVESTYCEVHRVDILRGGFCSWHLHSLKTNIFSVASGRLIIEQKVFPDNIMQTLLQPGDTLRVPAGVVHRFVAPFEPVRAFEIYYPCIGTILGTNDITRFGQGGIAP